jgi:hypothetical protein
MEVYVCKACGKIASEKYGEGPRSRGWDASCFVNSVAVDAGRIRYAGYPERAVLDAKTGKMKWVAFDRRRVWAALVKNSNIPEGDE